MDTDPTSAEVAALRRATGMPLLACRDLLRGASAAMREKLLLAARTQRGASYRRDPIEDDPALAAAFEESGREANRLVEKDVAAERAHLHATGMGHLDFMLRYT